MKSPKMKKCWLLSKRCCPTRSNCRTDWATRSVAASGAFRQAEKRWRFIERLQENGF
jgi:hypothetical protein